MNPELTIHWDFLKNTGDLKEGGGPGSTVRLDVLLVLIGHANAHSRCWPSVRTIAKEAGISDLTSIVAALNWLEERYAIYRIPVDLRYSSEHRLNPKKTVYELTGIIDLGGKLYPYLVMPPEDMVKAVGFVRDIGFGFKEVPDDDPDETVGATTTVDEDRWGYHNGSVGATTTGGVGATPTEVIPSLSSTKQSISTESGTPPLSSGHGQKIAPPNAFQAAKTETPVVDDDLVNEPYVLFHDLTNLLLKAVGRSALSRKEVKLLTSKKKYTDSEGRNLEELSPLDLWENAIGYSEFAKLRVTQFQGMGKPFDMENILSSLRNVNKRAEGRKWPGWYQWREQNPNLCTEARKRLLPGQELVIIDGRETIIEPNSTYKDDLPWMSVQLKEEWDARDSV